MQVRPVCLKFSMWAHVRSNLDGQMVITRKALFRRFASAESIDSWTAPRCCILQSFLLRSPKTHQGDLGYTFTDLCMEFAGASLQPP